MTNVEAQFAGVGATLSGDDGLLHPDNPLFDAANDGVSCTFCHQIDDVATLGTDDRLMFGQYNNPLTMRCESRSHLHRPSVHIFRPPRPAQPVNYQTMAYGYGQDLFKDVDEPRVALFKDLDDGARNRFETISSDSGAVAF